MGFSVLDSATKNAILSAISTQLGAGGTLEVQDSGGAVLAVLTGLTLGTPSAGSMTYSATPDSSNDATGTANKLVMKTSGGTAKVSIPIGDITFTPSTSVTSGGTATLSSGTLTL